jgi:hypothetical protein
MAQHQNTVQSTPLHQPLIVDVFVSTEGSAALVLGVTQAGDEWASTHLGKQWLGAHWVSMSDLDVIIRRMLRSGLTLRLDGHLVQP